MTDFMKRWLSYCAIAMAAIAVPTAAQQSGDAATKPNNTPTGTSPNATATPSKAEQIVRLESTLEKDRAQLSELTQKLEQHTNGEYAQAKDARKQLLSNQEELNKQLEQARKDNNPAEVKRLEDELKKLTTQLPLAKERFELAQAELENRQKLIDTVKTKIAAEEAELDRLQGKTPPTDQPSTAQAPPANANTGATPPPAEAPPQAQQPQAPPPTLPGMPQTTQPAAGTTPPPQSEEQKKRAKEIAEQQAVVQEAEQKLDDVQQRVNVLTEQKEALREGLQLAKRKVTSLRQRRKNLADQMAPLNASTEEYRALFQESEDARTQLREAEQEVIDKQQQLIDIQDQIASAEATKASLARDVDEQRTALEELENPFSLQNVQHWLLNSGPKVLIYILGIFVLRMLIMFIGRRISKSVAADDEHGSARDREYRANTLVSVFQNTATLIVIIAGLSMILQEFGISLTAFFGVAAIATVAIGFAAQSIVKDYFHGFLILLENQYTVNDVVKIAGIAGLVERITMRVTTLRDLEGIVHFVPNSQITTVSNMTHQWSRALIEVGVSYNEDVDRVMEVLMEIGRELRQDPKFRRVILEDPEMLGVDGFGDSAVVIKLFIKTYPLQQWAVKREFNRRMKKRFDELGIEIPFPHRTVYHRIEREHAESADLNAAFLAKVGAGHDER